MTRRNQSPRGIEARGGFGGAGGTERLHQDADAENRAVREAAGRNYSGRPLFYATAMTLAGVASGLLVESHMGRPTKIEGNREHPGSLGGTDVFAQAATLGLVRSGPFENGDARRANFRLASFQAAMANAKTQLLQGGTRFAS
jgi:hypothetical protein